MSRSRLPFYNYNDHANGKNLYKLFSPTNKNNGDHTIFGSPC